MKTLRDEVTEKIKVVFDHVLNYEGDYVFSVNGKKTPSPDMAKHMALLLGFDWRIFYADSTGAF